MTLYCIKGEATTPLFAHKKIFYRLFLHTLFTFVYELSTFVIRTLCHSAISLRIAMKSTHWGIPWWYCKSLESDTLSSFLFGNVDFFPYLYRVGGRSALDWNDPVRFPSWLHKGFRVNSLSHLYFWGNYLLYNLHYVNQIGLFWENKAIEYQPLSTGRHIVSKIV